jgi:hypothetical protein
VTLSRLTLSSLDRNESILNQITERHWLDGGDLSIPTRSGEEVSLPGLLGLALQVDLLPTLTGGLLRGLVALDARDDLLLTGGLANVLDAHVDALLEDASVDELIDAHAHGHLRYVEDDAGASVVVLVGHALVYGRVGEDVHVITDLHGHEVLG